MAERANAQETAEVPGASHALPVERAAEVNQLLTAFLAEHTTTDQTTAAHR